MLHDDLPGWLTIPFVSDRAKGATFAKAKGVREPGVRLGRFVVCIMPTLSLNPDSALHSP